MSTDTEPITPPTGRWLRFSAWLGRLWRSVVAYFSPPPPEPIPLAPVSPAPPPPPPGQVRGRRRLQTPMAVPASGYIFTFQVHATFIWSAEGVYQQDFSAAIDSLMPYTIRRLQALAAHRARHHPPHRARELELELQKELEEDGAWPYTWRGLSLTCRPYLWVELEDQVKQAVRPYWEQLIKLDCEHDVQMRRAEYAERLSRQWATILTDLMGSPVADGAAEMTEKELAEVVRRIVAEQKAAADKLEDLMQQKADGSDIFERSEYLDALIERLERRADHLYAGSGAAARNGREPAE